MLNSIIYFSIIILNIIISLIGFNDRGFFEKYSFNIRGIKKRSEPVRFISSAFLHVNSMHLIFNMITLYFFSENFINKTNIVLYLFVYFSSILIGNIFAYVKHRNNPAYTAVGASGGVSGVVFANILLFPGIKLYIMFIPFPIPGFVYAIFFILISVFGIRSGVGNIGHEAHLGGALTGSFIVLAAKYILGVI